MTSRRQQGQGSQRAEAVRQRGNRLRLHPATVLADETDRSSGEGEGEQGGVFIHEPSIAGPDEQTVTCRGQLWS